MTHTCGATSIASPPASMRISIGSSTRRARSSRSRDGGAGVLGSLGQIAADYEIDQYRPQSTIVDGDRAAVVSDVVFLQRGSQRRLNFRIVDLIKLRDGRVVNFEEFIDTFDVVEQALGQHIVIV